MMVNQLRDFSMDNNKNCITCVFYGEATIVCFNEKNEGMRVFNPTKATCQYYLKLY